MESRVGELPVDAECFPDKPYFLYSRAGREIIDFTQKRVLNGRPVTGFLRLNCIGRVSQDLSVMLSSTIRPCSGLPNQQPSAGFISARISPAKSAMAYLRSYLFL